MIIYPNNKNYMLFFKHNDDILSDENKKYISNLKERLVNTALHYLPNMHLSLPSNVPSEKVPNGSFNNTGKYSF